MHIYHTFREPQPTLTSQGFVRECKIIDTLGECSISVIHNFEMPTNDGKQSGKKQHRGDVTSIYNTCMQRGRKGSAV